MSTFNGPQAHRQMVVEKDQMCIEFEQEPMTEMYECGPRAAVEAAARRSIDMQGTLRILGAEIISQGSVGNDSTCARGEHMMVRDLMISAVITSRIAGGA